MPWEPREGKRVSSRKGTLVLPRDLCPPWSGPASLCRVHRDSSAMIVGNKLGEYAFNPSFLRDQESSGYCSPKEAIKCLLST